MLELKKCSECRFSRGCPTILEIRRSNRKGNLRLYMKNETLEDYNDLYANLCSIYKKVQKENEKR
jgi:hypothetical protein